MRAESRCKEEWSGMMEGGRALLDVVWSLHQPQTVKSTLPLCEGEKYPHLV